ncbi:MAG TPA: EamA family transporter [Solirubrobacteraceae bacterium]|jgi:drug/metabolite transporter (DMT)-like permease|nr:EamA family transporter [Solirubrobacteraceae bacterium]
MGVLLAVTAALGWGAADYFGGDATRRATPVFVVVAVAELIGAALLVPVLVLRGTPPPDDPRLLLAALAGVAVTVELSLIYRALSRGEAFITAPVGALGTAGAVGLGLVAGDPLGPMVAIGLACALLGGGLSASTSPTTAERGGTSAQSVAIAVGAAAAVATMLTALHAAGRLDPYWVTATEHVSTALSAGAAAVVGARGSRRIRPPRRSELPALGLVAALGVVGDVAYVSASHDGALSIVAAISSLYPLTTIALARVRQGQRATHLQLAGAGVALFGAALLGAVGG